MTMRLEQRDVPSNMPVGRELQGSIQEHEETELLMYVLCMSRLAKSEFLMSFTRSLPTIDQFRVLCNIHDTPVDLL